MNQHPIFFSAPMVKAILAGRKTQTRRVIKPSQYMVKYATERWGGLNISEYNEAAKQSCQVQLNQIKAGADWPHPCPYGQIGDRLWVRETWRCEELDSGLDGVRFKADNAFREIENTAKASLAWCVTNNNRDDAKNNLWRPSIFMPRWASRLTLEITNIRVERIQDISETDAQAEGVVSWSGGTSGTTYKPEYQILWDSINKNRGFSWASNPWVWVIEFKVV